MRRAVCAVEHEAAAGYCRSSEGVLVRIVKEALGDLLVVVELSVETRELARR